MLGNQITVTINAVAKILKLVNQDNFGAQYFLREPTGEYTVKVRHSREKGMLRGERMDRHNVELTYTNFGAGGLDDGYTTVVSTTIRNADRAPAAETDHLQKGVADFCKTQGLAIVGWES